MPHGLQLGLQLAPLQETMQDMTGTPVAHIEKAEEALQQEGTRQAKRPQHSSQANTLLLHFGQEYLTGSFRQSKLLPCTSYLQTPVAVIPC
jgi:hypothetical protein